MTGFSRVIMVLRMTRYSFTDVSTGELKSGCKVTYVTDWENHAADNVCGLDIAVGALPYEEWQSFVFPARCNADFDFSTDSKGRLVLKLKKIEYLAPLCLRDE